MAYQDLPANAQIIDGKIVHTIGNSAGVYNIRVKAGTNRPAGNVASGVFTLKPTLAVPANFTAVAISDSRIDLSWGAVSNATGYMLQRATDSNFTANVQTIYSGAAASVQNISGLTASTHYYYRVYATAANYNPSGYAFANATTLSAPNVAPVANAGADNSITLPTNSVTLTGSATDSDGTITGYAWTQVSGPNTATISNPNIAYPTASNLIEGTYEFQLTVTDDDGATNSNTVQVTVNAALILAPSDLTAGSTSGNSIDLHWTDNSDGEDSFIIERNVNDTGWVDYATISPNSTTYSDTGVSQNNKYAYRVKGKKGTYVTAPSNIALSAIVYAYNFTGVDDGISFPHSTALNLERTSPFTVSTWVQFPAVGDAIKFLFEKYDRTANRGIQIALLTTGFLNVLIRSTTTNQISIKVAADTLRSAVVGVNKFYHIGVTYSGNSLSSGVKFYFDGRQYDITALGTNGNTLTGTIVNTQPVLIGKGTGTGLQYSVHKQALTRMYAAELTAEQMATEYNKGLPLYALNGKGLPAPVLEMLVNTDSYATGAFQVKDTALNNHGSTTGMTIDQRYLVQDMDAIAAINIQPYTGDTFTYNTFGNAGGDDPATLMFSPFTDRMRTPIVYHPSYQSLMTWMQRGNIGWNREGMLFKLDHTNKIASPSKKIGYISPGTIDGHPFASVGLTPSGQVITVHEDVHNSSLYFSRTTGLEPATLEPLSVITGRYAYPNIITIGSTLYAWFRGTTGVPDGTNFGADTLAKSTDDGLTWTTAQILQLYNNTGIDRAYFLTIHDPDKLRFLVMVREDSIQKFTRLYEIESADGVTWQNVNGSFSKNITSNGPITRAEMDANFLALYDAEKDIHAKAAIISPSGKVYIAANDEVNNFRFLYYSNGWVSRPLPMPMNTFGSLNTSTPHAWGLYSYSDTHFVAFMIIPINGYRVVVRYETTDAFQTWDAGTVISDPAKNYESLQMTHNLRGANKIVIAATERAATSNNIFIHEFTP